MSEVESITKTTLQEIERLLNTKTVVGEPIAVDGATLIPLVSFGFGFGVAGAGGKDDTGEEDKNVTGGAGGIKPVAVIVIDQDGVKVEPVKRGSGRVLERIVETVTKGVENVTIGKPKDGQE